MNVKEILIDLGYQISEGKNEYSCRPLYRESNNKTALSINKKTGQFFDFVRGHGGSIEELIRLTLNFEDVSEAEVWLENKNFHIPDEEPKPLLKLPKIINEDELLLLPHNYWKEKGVSDSTIKAFKGGVAHGGSLARRYVFPIYNELGQVIGLSGRTVVDADPKWKHMGKKSTWVYPYYLNYNDLAASQEVILVESIGDMIALWESGFKNSLVMFGIKLNSNIITKLVELGPKRIIIATNNDINNSEAGNIAAEEIKLKLLNFFDPEVLYIGIPATHNDLMKLFEAEGVEGVKNWHSGLFLLE